MYMYYWSTLLLLLMLPEFQGGLFPYPAISHNLEWERKIRMNSKLFVLFHFVFSCLEWLERVTWCAVAMSLDTWDSREVYESDQWNQTYVEEIKLAAPVNWYLNVFEH